MKSKTLLPFVILLIAATAGHAQTLQNGSFENWITDTDYLSVTLPTVGTIDDTSMSLNPVNWTTSNELTDGKSFHHQSLVSQTTVTVYTGTSAMMLVSDTIHAQFGPYPLVFVCPGFAVCGDFKLDLSSFVNLSASFSPTALPNAGIAITGRKTKIGGYLKYQPVGGDTAYITAVLRQGSIVVAQATYLRSSTDSAYTYFEAPFVYLNCLMPDTMVYSISSGNPYSLNNVVLQTPTGLHQGSTLYADSVYLGDSISLPNAVNDLIYTPVNTPVNIHILANDQYCGSPTLYLLTQPAHGTAVLTGDSVMYTPASNFSGIDTFTYTETSGSQTADAKVSVSVGWQLGINEIQNAETSIYPNPVRNQLNISLTSPSPVSGFLICDMPGHIMKSGTVTAADISVDVSDFSDGIYLIQFRGNAGEAISASRFVVIK